MLFLEVAMTTSRTINSLKAIALCWLAMAGVAVGQGSIIRVPHLGGGHVTVRALNNHGAVAGFSITAAGEQHSILFSGGVARDLGTLGGMFSSGLALNDSGAVVGDSDLPDWGPQHAFLYTNGPIVDLGALPEGQFSSASIINNAGHIAGLASGSDGFTRGFIYRNGTMTDIGSLGSGLSTIEDLNESGHAVGYSLDESFQPLAFYYNGVSMINLGTLGGAFSRAWAINDSGVIVGESDNSNGVAQAFVYRDGQMTQLGTLGGSSALAYGINNAGQILGDSLITGDLATHAFVISSETMTDLGTLGGDNSYPNAMNRHGHVVGDSEDDLGFVRPFLYRDGQMVDLNTLLPENSGWVLDTAYYLNDAGQIVGYGTHNGEFAWYIFTPGNDNTPPVANAGADQTVECSTAAHLDASGSTDDDNDTLTYEWRNGDTVLGTSALLDVTLARGTHTLTLVVSDQSASTEDTVTITVNDTTAPSVACVLNQTVAVGADCQGVVPDFATSAVASDGCSSVLTRSQSPVAGSSVGVGTHTVTVSVTDESGNVGTCTVTLTVIDSTAPSGECPLAQTVNAGAECTVAVPDFTAALLATDNCTPVDALVKTQSPAAGTLVTGGTHIITLTVSDAAGNRSECTTTFTVRGGGAEPSVTAPAPVIASAGLDGKGAIPDLAGRATVIESCSGPATRSQTPAAGTRLGIGVHTVTIRVVDPAGNVATCATTCTVKDTTPPTIKSISVNPNVIKKADGDMDRFTVSVRSKDNLDRNLRARIVSITSNQAVTGGGNNTSPDWTITDDLRGRVRAEYTGNADRIYRITVECRDDAGNVATETVTITVKRGKGKKD
jgi:probable HAF family extracellular repeat protein